ncbi:MAG: serine hydrolase domain-containing protein, partial [Planctomycetota bacterium]
MICRRTFLLVCLCFAVLSPCAAGEWPLEQWNAWRRHAANRCPQQTWLKYATPEEAGWSSETLAKAREYSGTIGSAAVLVVYDGAVLAAWGEIETSYMCHSIRKSLLSALYGVHVAEGRIDLDETLAELNIDDQPPLTDAEKRARVIDLLKSRSGIYHPAAYETPKMREKRPERGTHEPGEVFWYNNWDFNALCTIFERQTGTKVFQEFQKRFALPLGMEDFRLQDTYYHLEPEHSIHPAYPFRMSARDMARFGLLFLRGGRWQDQQILTERWVRESTASHFEQGDTTANPQYAYGYLWWPIVEGPFKDLQMFSARGYGGHSIDIVPLANLVFVHRVETFWDL